MYIPGMMRYNNTLTWLIVSASLLVLCVALPEAPLREAEQVRIIVSAFLLLSVVFCALTHAAAVQRRRLQRQLYRQLCWVMAKADSLNFVTSNYSYLSITKSNGSYVVEMTMLLRSDLVRLEFVVKADAIEVHDVDVADIKVDTESEPGVQRIRFSLATHAYVDHEVVQMRRLVQTLEIHLATSSPTL